MKPQKTLLRETGRVALGVALLTVIMLLIYAALNRFAFLLMLHDKRSAKKGNWRVPEKMLFLSAALFGAFGGTAAMWLFRHKTKHWYFAVFFPLMAVVQTAVVAYAIVRLN